VKLGVISLGCDKATVDSETLIARFVGHGAEVTAALDDADVILVNTCGFIDAAKKESIDAMLEAARYKNEGRCRAVVVFGESGGKIEGAFRAFVGTGRAAMRRVESLAEAVEAARSLAETGDVVLLSPACTSYDAYESFERRGEHFRSLVKQMIKPDLTAAEGEVQPSLP